MVENSNINIMEMVKLKVMMGLGGENSSSIYVIIFMFLFSLLEKHMQIIIKTIQDKINNRYNTIVYNLVEKTNDKYSIFLEKDFSEKNKDKDYYTESILHNISEKYNIKSVIYLKSLYIINFFERFIIEDDIYCKLHVLEIDSECNLTKIKLQISSDILSVIELKKYVEKCVDIYKRKIQNNLGSHLYFFDQKANKQQFIDGSKNKSPFLEFEYNKFVTNRNFNNVFGENIDVLKKRVTFFKNSKKWYDEKGIPYTFGALLYGIPGTGKCHGKNTPILMFDGTIKMVQDIKIGESVMGDDSTSRKVLSLGRGKDIMYKITNVKDESYIVNSEHILSLIYSHKKCIRNRVDRSSYQVCWFNNKLIKIESKTFKYNLDNKIDVYNQTKYFLDNLTEERKCDISITDYLKLNKSIKNNLKGYKVNIEFSEKQLNFDPYIIGLWLGNDKSSDTSIKNQDASILHYLVNILPKYKCNLQYDITEKEYRINGEKNKGNQFMNELKNQNLINDKHIPMIYKCNSREKRLFLLAGLLDSAGNLDNWGYFYFSQKSEKLMDDTIYLCRSLGFSCYKNKQKKEDNYRICISGNINEIPNLCHRKKVNKIKQKDVLVSGITIEKIKRDNYYGFELDGNHRYLMGNFTVTHNTSIIKAIANECNRHIININLANIQTNTQLKNLFYSKSLQCKDQFQNITFDIGIDERLYIIEDIDCMSDVVLDRKLSTALDELETDDLIEHVEVKKEISCDECKKGHHEEHCYNKIKKHCPHCENILKEVSECKCCNDNYKHCDILGHCEEYLCQVSENPRRCNFCLNLYQKKSLEKTKGYDSSNVSNLASYNIDKDKEKENEKDDIITLSSLLNILDGTLELPGRMIIITSNYPEKLDKALIRPGRIDLILELGKTSHNTIKNMYESFYNKKLDDTIIFESNKWTPAEINCIFFNNFDNIENAINDIINTEPNSLSKF